MILSKKITPETLSSVRKSDINAFRAMESAYKTGIQIPGMKELPAINNKLLGQRTVTLFKSNDGKKAEISYAGTRNSMTFDKAGAQMGVDWIQNAVQAKVPFFTNGKYQGTVAAGSYSRYLETRGEVMKQVDGLIKGGVKQIEVSGHSAGGPNAIFLATEIRNKYPDVKVNVVTMGAPAFQGSSFANNYNKLDIPTTRYTFGNDIVPSTGFNGRHIGEHIQIPTDIRNPIGNHNIGNFHKTNPGNILSFILSQFDSNYY